MRSRLSIALLALGTVLGYGMGIHGMLHRGHRREAFERHVADVCVAAAAGLKSNVATPKAPSAEPPAPSTGTTGAP
jgi:hypothetical protein